MADRRTLPQLHPLATKLPVPATRTASHSAVIYSLYLPLLLRLVLHRLHSFRLILQSQVSSEDNMSLSIRVQIFISTGFYETQLMIVFQNLHAGIYSRGLKWLSTKAMVS